MRLKFTCEDFYGCEEIPLSMADRANIKLRQYKKWINKVIDGWQLDCDSKIKNSEITELKKRLFEDEA